MFFLAALRRVPLKLKKGRHNILTINKLLALLSRLELRKRVVHYRILARIIKFIIIIIIITIIIINHQVIIRLKGIETSYEIPPQPAKCYLRPT
jgi:hypothetical protein